MEQTEATSDIPAPSTSPTRSTEAPPPTTHDEQPLFNATWDSSDRNALHPSHLPLSKVHRAWERKPKSPFSRRRFRVGKVWKRANGLPSIPGFSSSASAYTKSNGSPLKAVKKLCLESGFGVGAQVRDWELRGSPVARRIVTRSITTNEEPDELIALSEEEDGDEGRDDITVQIINQDGTVEEPNADEIMDTENDEWSDVEGEGKAEAYDDTLMHLEEAVRHTTDLAGQDDDRERSERAVQSVTGASTEPVRATPGSDEHVVPVETTGDDLESWAHASASPQSNNAQKTPIPDSHAGSPQKNIGLPQGFISPAVRRRRSIKQTRLMNAARRNTLPVNFATAIFPTQSSSDVSQPTVLIPWDTADSVELSNTQNDNIPEEGSAADAPEETGDSEEWEDVETTDSSGKDASTQEEESVQCMDGADVSTSIEDGESISPRKAVKQPPTLSPRALRRQSTSPLKQSSIWPKSDRSHLIAFTPVKPPAFSLSVIHPETASCSAVTGTPSRAGDLSMNEQALSCARASSAPPEEPRMSPQKPRHPRISDDTALLQAFLNRAAESRSSRRLSETARRESLENRRDSDSVRRALASTDATATPIITTTPTVLMDLDPNSPSPRKVTAAAEAQLAVVDAKPNSSVEDGEHLTPDPSSHRTSSRRSGRVKQKQETLAATTYTAPNKISIRSNADCVVLKRSEAQELALLTRNNTRKNKGGSVLPPLRLTKMAKDVLTDEGTAAPPDSNRGTKSVQWAETLTAYRRFSPDAEESFVGDESAQGGHEPSAADADVEMADMSNTIAAPAPIDTPSKPRARRVKPTRISPATVPEPTDPPTSVTFDVPAPVPEPEEQAKPKATKRKSRIATPAKMNGKSLLSLADESDDTMKAPSQPQGQKPSSKLPAPTGGTSASGSSTLALGKEGSLIASPPKKRLRPTTSSIPATLGKGTSVSKLDLTRPAITFDAGQQQRETNANTGLASPAKRRSGAFLLASGEETSGSGMGSPAKRRTRRAIR